MRACGEGCEIRTGADRPPPVARSHPDAMKEFQPSLRRAADNLRRAYSQCEVLFRMKTGRRAHGHQAGARRFGRWL
jgi:hypothetical protein